MKIFMKHKIFLLAMLFMAFSQSLFSIELDTVWVSDEYGQILFQHPVSKNILIAKNGITELYSDNGKFVREFPLTGSCLEISPDGNKFLYCAPDGVRIFDASTLEDILTITTKYWYPKFLDNERIVFLSGINTKTEVGKYNIKNKELNFYPFGSEDFTALATSPDGKYISYATYQQNNTTDSKVYLYLMDTETMKEIKQLGSWETEKKQIRSIRFSPDSKYLTYSPEYFYHKFPVQIFDLSKQNIIKSYTPFSFNFYNCTVTFLDKDLYIVRGRNLDVEESEVRIYNINNDKLLFKTNEFSKYIQTLVYESDKNYLYCNTPTLKTYCFDLNNIISGIPPTNPINIRYNNKTLLITQNDKPISNLTINTIEGREVYKQNFEQIGFQNQIEIPLDLSNGLYFININSDNNITTHKLLVKE